MKTTFLIAALAGSTTALAQNDMDNMPGMNHKMQHDTVKATKHGMTQMDNTMSEHSHGMQHMSSGLSVYLPMSRDGSGTSWLPDAAPLYMYMTHSAGWMFMFGGDVFVRYNRQDITNAGSRGGDKWDAPDMLMAMAQRKVGEKGIFRFNSMFSTDALIAGGSGYPLLFQTGESWHGQPLVDRQHPHDLFSELSVSYAYSFSHKADAYVYVGYPGEPALGPVTFMHRPSGEFIPDAPIGHHWEDATHITFGVATVGVRYGDFKLEGSSFTGREPDENRYNFDKPLFDSWSGRLSFNPSANWALQVSHGFLKSPEALRPDEDVNRTTASATYVSATKAHRYFTATALWGQNVTPGQEVSNAALLEATAKMKRAVWYLRYEWVQKSVEELNLNPMVYGANNQFDINSLTAGAGYDLLNIGFLTMAGGLQVTLDHPNDKLTSLYGEYPLSGEVYLHFYPKRSM